MKKSLVVVVLASLTAFGCSSKENEIVVQNESSCLASLDVLNQPVVFAEDVADGRPGLYRLVESRTFSAVESDYGSYRAYLGGTTRVSKNADPSRFNISSVNDVSCFHMDNEYGSVTARSSVPLAFSRETGKAPEELKYSVSTEFVKVTEKTLDKAKVSSSTTTTSRLYSSSSVLNDSNQTVHRLADGKVAIRLEELDKKSKSIVIGIYELAN